MKLKDVLKKVVVVMVLGAFCIQKITVQAESVHDDNNEFVPRRIVNAFDEADMQNDFLTYTENSYTYTSNNKSKNNLTREAEAGMGNVIGAVYDCATGNFLSNMQICFKELDYCIATGEDGRFEIEGIPDGYYTLVISGDGYFDATYSNMPISHYTGTDIYSLAISKNHSIYEEIVFATDCNTEESLSACTSNEYEPVESMIQTTSYTVPTLPSFSVNYNGTITTYGAMNYYYLYYVVASELLRPDSTYYASMTDNQKLEGFKAQAVAARTYATTRAAWGLAHLSSGYNFCSTTCCQVYNPSYTNTLTVQAVNATHNEIVYDVSRDRLCDTFFFASCTGNTKSYAEVWGENVSYLVSVNCPYDIRPSLSSGHGVGMCQDGAMGLAGQGYTYDEIIEHYYTGTEVITANPASQN